MGSDGFGRLFAFGSRSRKLFGRRLRSGLFDFAWRRKQRDRGARAGASGFSLVAGFGSGAGLMYLLDPNRGRRRRALIRDQFVHLTHVTAAAAAVTSRDLGNRARGLFAELTSLFRRDNVDDVVLVERVRASLGRTVSHPSSIEVTAHNGVVTLSGPILAGEVDRLLDRVSSVRGVQALEDRLELHSQAGAVPGLQGAAAPGRFERIELMQPYWTPAMRFLATAIGGAAATYGVVRRDLLGAAMSSLGLGLIARGLTNLSLKRLVGLGGGRRAIDIHKTINLAAPVEQVFAFWSRFENFPRFMAHVREVRAGDGQSHWVVAGPAGVPIEWNTVITKLEPNRLIAWKTLPGEAIAHAGIVRFDPNPDGSTRLDIQMSYNPLAGGLGHSIATLFGVDPKSAMDADLVRLKSLLEHGQTSADGQRVTREQLADRGQNSRV
ncbi:MAG: SRPBCC family protein [Chloroflexi bacterium]|nr:SRPBCC family protein [Chloroflexota bacterium]